MNTFKFLIIILITVYPFEPFSEYKQLGNCIDGLLSSMSLREKIAQMIISSVVPENIRNKDENSFEMNRLRKLCEENKIGGFIFFKGSIEDYISISNRLQSYSSIPLLISADFERGIKMRVSDGVIFPNNMAIGATRNTELCYQMGREIARQMKIIGIHQNYSPVCDVNNNPLNPIINVRSFGEDPILVADMSVAMIKGLQDEGVIATAKHFPGHGDTEIDSHNDLPILSFQMDRLNKIELVPFKRAIDAGVLSIMVAHLAFPALESDLHIPASLSSAIVKDLLINEIGFDGLIITDALNMKGITKYFTNSQVAVMCVKAGIDLILMPENEAGAIDAIEKAIIDGVISEAMIDHSVRKILSVKNKLGLFENKIVPSEDAYNKIHSTEALELSQIIADESVTLVVDKFDVLPVKNISKNKFALVIVSEGGEADNTESLISKSSDYLPNVEVNPSNYSDYDYVIIALFAKVRFGTGKISISEENVKLIKKIISQNKNTIAVSFGNPYLIKEFPLVPAYICLYGDSDVSITAALKAISGKISFRGKLPVSISDEYKYGTGIIK